MRAVLLGAIAFAGCASADRETIGRPDGGGINHPMIDAPTGQPHPDSSTTLVDAAPSNDAPSGPQSVTLTQTTSNTMTPANSIACPAATVGTSANTYYRVFDLPNLGITTAFTVTSVSFQVEDCESVNANGAAVAVRVGTYTGTVGGTTLQPGTITILASNNTVQVPEVDATPAGAQVDAPISATIPAGSKLIVEVDAPEGNNQYQFYIGTNTGGQSTPGYVSSARCTPPGTTPTDVGTLVTPAAAIDLLLTVTGTH